MAAAGVADVVYDVVIVGAGWSGLAASNYLIDAGITDNLLVVEARDRIGGRTNTIVDLFQDGHPVEVGSQWIYQGTYIHDLVDSLGIASDPSIWEWDTLGLYGDSGQFPEAEQSRLINAVYRKDFIPYAYENSAFNKDWVSLLTEYYRSDRGLTNLEKQTIHGMLTQGIIIEYGSPLSETNSAATVSNLGRGDWRSIDNMAVAGGTGGGYTAAITKGLADNLSPEQILLDAPVTRIDRTGSDGIVRVTAGGGVIRAKSVLVTVPVGVLQQPSSSTGGIEFLPPLSDEKLRAIDSIPMGVLNKVILYWDHTTQDVSWWPHGQVDMELVTDDGATSDDFTYFYNDHEHAANQDYYTLTAFSGGKPAERIESLSDEETIELVLNNVKTMFGAETVPTPTSYLVSRWHSDEYARGAYSFDRVGTNAQKFRKALAEPEADNLYFAGEAADTDGWFATTAGAYSTGIKASSAIAESGVLSGSGNGNLEPTCTALNAACDGGGSGLPCCKGTVCSKDGLLGGTVCLLSTVALPRPGSQKSTSAPAEDEPVVADDADSPSSSTAEGDDNNAEDNTDADSPSSLAAEGDDNNAEDNTDADSPSSSAAEGDDNNAENNTDLIGVDKVVDESSSSFVVLVSEPALIGLATMLTLVLTIQY